MAGLLPAEATRRMFVNGADLSYTEKSNTDKVLSISEIGLWLVSIRFYGNNVEHMSSYLFSNAGLYAKKLVTLSEYNYNSNSSVTVRVNDAGKAGFIINAIYSSLNGNIFVTARRLV